MDNPQLLNALESLFHSLDRQLLLLKSTTLPLALFGSSSVRGLLPTASWSIMQADTHMRQGLIGKGCGLLIEPSGKVDGTTQQALCHVHVGGR